jgi:hypothetical protein
VPSGIRGEKREEKAREKSHRPRIWSGLRVFEPRKTFHPGFLPWGLRPVSDAFLLGVTGYKADLGRGL